MGELVCVGECERVRVRERERIVLNLLQTLPESSFLFVQKVIFCTKGNFRNDLRHEL